MKIAQIVCRFPPYYGGMGNVVYELSSALIQRGHDVRVITPLYGDEQPDAAVEDLQADVRRLRPRLQFGNAARLSSIADEIDGADVVHLHYPFFGTAGLVYRWKKRHPEKLLVMTYHMDNRARGLRGVFFALYRWFWMPKILRCADVLLGSSLDYITHSDARGLYQRFPDRWREIPFGVDVHRFQPREPDVALYHRYGLDPSLPTVVFVGGMDAAHDFKGVAELLQAVRILKNRAVALQVLFVGGGDLLEQYQWMARGMGVSEQVCFAGYVSDVELPYHYNVADVTVLPSTTQGEAFGVVLLESMASAVPVIASDLPGVRTVAAQGGVCVAPGDPRDIADAIQGLFEQDADTYAQLCENVRLVVEEQYRWGVVAAQHEAVYEAGTRNHLST